MRTTVDLPDETFRKLKTVAVQRGTTLKQLLRTAVENELQRLESPAKQRRLKFPLLDSTEPGSLKLTNAQIEDLLA